MSPWNLEYKYTYTFTKAGLFKSAADSVENTSLCKGRYTQLLEVFGSFLSPQNLLKVAFN